jgi:3-oxoacyl-[acyl-carrier protein] reductase
MNTYDLKDRAAIITGAGQGIGLTVAELMLANGASVSIWDRDQRLLDTLAERYGSDSRVQLLNVDIGKLEDVGSATQEVKNRFGKIDILINNAAIVGPNANTWEYPPQAFMDVVHIGLVGTFFVSRTVVPHMIAQNYGRIVNVASVAGKEGNPNAAHYSASKAGLIGYTKSLAKELATKGVLVNCVTPAAAKTDIFNQMTEQHIAFMLSKIPMGRFVEPEEIAALICWLASPDCSFSTGAVFDISGGRATY